MSTPDTTTNALIERLEALLPELRYSQETHVLWRDCDQSKRDRNPEIGDPEFHDQCVKVYAERIEAITETMKVLRTLSDENEKLKEEIKKSGAFFL